MSEPSAGPEAAAEVRSRIAGSVSTGGLSIDGVKGGSGVDGDVDCDADANAAEDADATAAAAAADAAVADAARRAAAARRADEEAARQALVKDHNYCHICGLDLSGGRSMSRPDPANANPLAQEHRWLVHYASTHLLDEQQAGQISAEDVDALHEYLWLTPAQRRKMLLDADPAKLNDPELLAAQAYHLSVRRWNNCLALIVTMLVAGFAWSAREGRDETSWARQMLGKMMAFGANLVRL